MGPEVIELADLTRADFPSSLLLETSFVCDAIWGQRGLDQDRAQLSWEFVQQAGSSGRTRLWVTPAVVQEAIFAFMKPDMRREAVLRTGRELTWAALEREYPADFAEAHAACIIIARQIRAVLIGSGIEESVPRVRLDAQTTGRWIAAYMSWYLRHYPIEPADALHLACARVDGTRAIASNDLDLQAVGGFQFLAYRRAP